MLPLQLIIWAINPQPVLLVSDACSCKKLTYNYLLPLPFIQDFINLKTTCGLLIRPEQTNKEIRQALVSWPYWKNMLLSSEDKGRNGNYWNTNLNLYISTKNFCGVLTIIIHTVHQLASPCKVLMSDATGSYKP